LIAQTLHCSMCTAVLTIHGTRTCTTTGIPAIDCDICSFIILQFGHISHYGSVCMDKSWSTVLHGYSDVSWSCGSLCNICRHWPFVQEVECSQYIQVFAC